MMGFTVIVTPFTLTSSLGPFVSIVAFPALSSFAHMASPRVSRE